MEQTARPPGGMSTLTFIRHATIIATDRAKTIVHRINAKLSRKRRLRRERSGAPIRDRIPRTRRRGHTSTPSTASSQVAPDLQDQFTESVSDMLSHLKSAVELLYICPTIQQLEQSPANDWRCVSCRAGGCHVNCAMSPFLTFFCDRMSALVETMAVREVQQKIQLGVQRVETDVMEVLPSIWEQAIAEYLTMMEIENAKRELIQR